MLSLKGFNSQEIKPQFKPTRPVRLREDYSFSYNSKCLNKPKPNDKNVDFTSYYSYSGGVDDIINFVNRGCSINGSTFQKSYRKKENIITTELLIADVDYGLSLKDALENEFIKRYLLGYTSPSHQINGNSDRFRLIGFSPVPLTIAEYETLLALINERFLGGVIDPNAMECGRGFYGNDKAQWFNTNPHELPFELILEARKIIEEREKEREKKRQANSPTENIDISASELEKALSFIPPDTDYKTWISIAMGLYHHFGGEDEGLTLFDRWSSGGSKYKGFNESQSKWNSFSKGFSGEPITVRTIFKMAIDNGYTPPRIEGKDYKGFSKEAFKLWKIRQYELLTKFTPDITFNERFVNDRLIELDFLGKGTTVQSAKFTGKSYFLPNLVRKIRKPILIIGNRILLTKNLAEDLKAKGIAVTFIDDTYKPDLISSLVNNGEHLAIVVDSLGKLKDLDLSDYFIIVDESEQVTETIGVSTTHIENVRGIVWGVLSSIISHCQGYLLMDADSSDRVSDYWFGLNPNLPTQKVLNTYRLQQEAVIYPSGLNGKITIMGKLYDSLAEGKVIAVKSDSKDYLTELYKLLSPRYKTVLITAPNLNDTPSLNRFLSDKGKAIAEESIQLVLISPVAQSGLSIELENYFDDVFGLFYGSVPTNIARQMLIRVRANCTRHIWANSTGFGVRSRFNWKEILSTDLELREYIKESIDYYSEVEKLSSIDAVKKVVSLMESGQNLQDINNKNVAQCKALINLNKSLYRELLLEEMAREGYSCLLAEENTANDLVEQLKAIGSELKLDEAKRAYFAPSIVGNEERIEYLKRKPNLNENERSEYLKYQIEKTLPELDALTIPFILEYIIKDKFKVINGVQNFFLVNNPEIAKRLDFNAFSYAISQCHQGGVFYLSSKKYSLLVDVWQGLNLNGLFGDTFTSESATELLNQVTPRIRNILRSLGIRWSKNSHSVTVLSKIFQLFGFKTSKVKTIRGVRFYKIKPIELIKDEDTWLSIFNSISLKFSGELNKENDIYSLIQSECTQSITDKDFGGGAVPEVNKISVSDTAPLSSQDISNNLGHFPESTNDIPEKDDSPPPPPPPKKSFSIGQKLILNNEEITILEVYPSMLKVNTSRGVHFIDIEGVN